MKGAWKLAMKDVVRCGLKKLRGCIAAPPVVPFKFPKSLTASSWLSFWLPFYSPLYYFEFSRQHCWRSAYSISMYRVMELSCQEESDCDERKSEIRKNYKKQISTMWCVCFSLGRLIGGEKHPHALRAQHEFPAIFRDAE